MEFQRLKTEQCIQSDSQSSWNCFNATSLQTDFTILEGGKNRHVRPQIFVTGQLASRDAYFKVQENMQTQLKTIQMDLSKDESSTKVSTAANELQFLMDFNASITHAMTKTMEHLSDFVFVSVANTTLARRDSTCYICNLG